MGFPVTLMLSFPAKISELPDLFLMIDADAESRSEALNLLNTFYPKNKITEDTVVRILIFGRREYF
jgi:hypothetical protein